MKPFLLEPFPKAYIWGGQNLVRYGKTLKADKMAESWELSAHPDGPAKLKTGPLKGMSFIDFVNNYPGEWKRDEDKAEGANPNFPILVKFIDAQNSLSIQVHPNDSYAMEHEGEFGKTEMWYILEAEPDAFLYYGFEHEIGREEFAERIKNDTLTDVLHRQPVKAGEAYFIPAGTIHAIGKGIVLAEIQQSSNSTYRVYDFGRRDKDGNLRPLHIDKAIDVTELKPVEVESPLKEDETGRLIDCPYFRVAKLDLHGNFESKGLGHEGFRALLFLDGEATLRDGDNTMVCEKGDCLFIPASCLGFSLDGKASILDISH
jgi:mannose-6-phosphate isomerase